MTPTPITPDQWQQLIDADPATQAAIRNTGPFNPNVDVALANLVQRYNVQPPDGYTLDTNSGRVITNGSSWGGFARGALAIAGTLATLGAASPATAALVGGAGTALASAGGSDPYNVPSDGLNQDGTLASSPTGNGDSTLPDVGPSGNLTPSGGGGTGSPSNGLNNLLQAGGRMISSATTASQSNQRSDAEIQQNARVQDAQLEAQQRQQALKNIFAQGFVSSGSHSPYDPTPPVPSAAYIAALNNLSTQGSSRLSQAPQYATTNFPSPSSMTQASPLQTAGTYLGPGLQLAGATIPWLSQL